MTTDFETRVNRRNTEAFIAGRPINIALVPSVETRTKSGGRLQLSDVPRATQTFRLIEQTTSQGNNPGRVATDGGHQELVTWQLLGTFDSIMEVNDTWMGDDGQKYVIRELLPYNGYERRGRVVQYGPE